MLALEESWVKLPQCHLPWPSPTHQKKKLNYSTLDSNGSCTQLDFQVPPSILWSIKPQVTWKALLLPSETCKTVCFPILTISKHPGGRMDTWGFHRQDAYVDFKGLLLACCFCLPSMNDIFQPQEHYFPLGIIHFLSHLWVGQMRVTHPQVRPWSIHILHLLAPEIVSGMIM